MTKPNPMSYPWEKLKLAVEALATGTGTLQGRLETAYLSSHTLKGDDFADNEMREKWLSIERGMTKEAAVGSEGAIAATVAKMDDDDARSIAELFYSLFLNVAERYYPRESELG